MLTDDIEHMFYKDMDSQNYKIIAVGNPACYNFCYLTRHTKISLQKIDKSLLDTLCNNFNRFSMPDCTDDNTDVA